MCGTAASNMVGTPAVEVLHVLCAAPTLNCCEHTYPVGEHIGDHVAVERELMPTQLHALLDHLEVCCQLRLWARWCLRRLWARWCLRRLLRLLLDGYLSRLEAVDIFVVVAAAVAANDSALLSKRR